MTKATLDTLSSAYVASTVAGILSNLRGALTREEVRHRALPMVICTRMKNANGFFDMRSMGLTANELRAEWRKADHDAMAKQIVDLVYEKLGLAA
ncbi:hypothetical protein [Paramagnetospirillum kuznetsovii]|nr:hypothetical protein [Paramagnetospirillum kuznetsovii]